MVLNAFRSEKFSWQPTEGREYPSMLAYVARVSDRLSQKILTRKQIL